MKRVLLTGMSGVGKSTLVGRLSELGYRAYDVDDEGWTLPSDDGGRSWREDVVERLLSERSGPALFLSGCSESQVRFYPHFDAVVLLSAPPSVLRRRLRTRTNNPYGKRPDELADVLGYVDTVEPLLRKAADHEIDATLPVEEVLDRLLQLVGEHPRAGTEQGST